ncbi:hypothetical protein E2C01_083445 [Portunus trituberculatus]|uniref:Uncharacterized protein n=1 Tax=Portunus trituberculatus TaxID=210409 RepID=A0A5B7J4P6_PORTR|nr:hypothetical protein [Portunus trituberculatus]
MSRTSGGPD